mgnify:CR=1 FL=1
MQSAHPVHPVMLSPQKVLEGLRVDGEGRAGVRGDSLQETLVAAAGAAGAAGTVGFPGDSGSGNRVEGSSTLREGVGVILARRGSLA